MWLPLKFRSFAHCCGHLIPAPNDWGELTSHLIKIQTNGMMCNWYFSTNCAFKWKQNTTYANSFTFKLSAVHSFQAEWSPATVLPYCAMQIQGDIFHCLETMSFLQSIQDNFTLQPTFKQWFNRANASMNKSAPLFPNSYRPAMKK